MSAGRDETGGPRMLRLAFHDCLRYMDGSGGCDGCLQWEGMDNVLSGSNGRVEDREYAPTRNLPHACLCVTYDLSHMHARRYEDHERVLNNNGLRASVEFLESIYTLDLGQTWASACWQVPATITSAQFLAGPFSVGSHYECASLCRNTSGCAQFTVPFQPWINNGNGPCRLFEDGGTVRKQERGRLIAGRATCPEGTPSWSLKSRGKSRADLWAFAAYLAVEEGIARNNWACDGDRRGPHNGPIQCIQKEGEAGCHIRPSRPFTLKTGRKDCATSSEPSYMASKHEYHPDEHFNGTMAIRFMEVELNMSARETGAQRSSQTVDRRVMPRPLASNVASNRVLAHRSTAFDRSLAGAQSRSWERTPSASSTSKGRRTSTCGPLASSPSTTSTTASSLARRIGGLTTLCAQGWATRGATRARPCG